MRAPLVVPYRQKLDPGWDPHREADMSLCLLSFNTLQLHYPGHFWRIEVDSKQGLAKIQIHQLMGDTLWYAIRLDESDNHNDYRKAVIKAGGAILERYGLPRSGMDVDKFREARAMTPIRPTVSSPIPEGDLRIFNPTPAPTAVRVEGSGQNMSLATSTEADAA